MRSLTAAFVAAAVLGLSTLPGCNWSSWGLGSSTDRLNYTSTVHTPYTVTLMDTSTGETLWTYEVPVGKTLSVRFLEPYDSDANGQDTMKWEVFPAKRVGSTLSNSMPCPNAASRILKVYFRQSPEAFPAQEVAAASVPAEPAPEAKPDVKPEAAAPEAAPAAPAKHSDVVLPDPKQASPNSTPAEPAKPEEPKAPPVDLPQ